MEKILKKTIEQLQSTKTKSDVDAKEIGSNAKLIMLNKNYTSLPLDANNVYAIERKESTQQFAFLDGGNQNIYHNNQLSIDAIRTYVCIFRKDKKIMSKRFDYIAIIKALVDEDKQELQYVAELISNIPDKTATPAADTNTQSDKQEFMFVGKDEHGKIIPIVEIASKIRRLLELATAAKVLTGTLSSYDTLVLDGTLEYKDEQEESLICELERLAAEKNILVCAIAKSTTMYTNTDDSYDTLLMRFVQETSQNAQNQKSTDRPLPRLPIRRFVYYPAFQLNKSQKNPHKTEHLPQIYFAKLHEKSNLILRIDLFSNMADYIDIQKWFGQIAYFAKDPLVLGYPYGLVDADKFARITNEDADYLRTIFLVRCGCVVNDLHSVLDKISF